MITTTKNGTAAHVLHTSLPHHTTATHTYTHTSTALTHTHTPRTSKPGRTDGTDEEDDEQPRATATDGQI